MRFDYGHEGLPFENVIQELPELGTEIRKKTEECCVFGEAVQLRLKYLYADMSRSDALGYPFKISWAKHGAEHADGGVWKEQREDEEALFLDYRIFHRGNTSVRANRRFFFRFNSTEKESGGFTVKVGLIRRCVRFPAWLFPK